MEQENKNEEHTDVSEENAATDDCLSEEHSLKAEIEVLKKDLLLALAESENIRKRAEKEKKDASRYSISSFAKEILIVRDNLILALKNSGKESGICEGIRLTLSEVDKIFKKNGIVLIDALGKIFDPNFHQVMFEVVDSNKEPGTVIEVIQDGFMIEERLLRPSLVGVSKKTETP